MRGMRQATTLNVLMAIVITLLVSWCATNFIFHAFHNSLYDAGGALFALFLPIGAAIGWLTIWLFDFDRVEPYFGAVVGAVVEFFVMLLL